MNLTAANFPMVTLKGHRASVNVIKATSSNILFSGSDDKTVRVWDNRSHRSSKCIIDCIHDGVQNITILPDSDLYICVASGTSLLTFDLRKYNHEVLIREATRSFTSSSEDINDVCIQSHSERYLATADDDCTISIIKHDSNGMSVKRRLSRVHTNICSCVAFHPRLQYDLLSGNFILYH
jgi:WD40 repeat protein